MGGCLAGLVVTSLGACNSFEGPGVPPRPLRAKDLREKGATTNPRTEGTLLRRQTPEKVTVATLYEEYNVLGAEGTNFRKRVTTP